MASSSVNRIAIAIRSLNPFPIEFHGRAGSVDFQSAARSDGIRTDENPVLPGGKPAKDAGFKRLVWTEAEIGFESGERVRRLRDARLDGLACLGGREFFANLCQQ